MLHLRQELDRKGISVKAFAAFLGVTEKTAQNKLAGRTEFTYPEAKKTKSDMFPEYDLEYLLSDVKKSELR